MCGGDKKAKQYEKKNQYFLLMVRKVIILKSGKTEITKDRLWQARYFVFLILSLIFEQFSI